MNNEWNLINRSDYKIHDLPTENLSSHAIDDSIEKGSKVRLIFNSYDIDSKEQVTELLWVEILLVQDNKYLGQLEDDPKIITNLLRGQIVDFEKRHIYESEYIDPFDSSIKI